MKTNYILIVEDDKHVAEVMAMVLESEGYQTKWALSLEKARTLYDEQFPILILLDGVYPDGDPKDFMDHVRSTHPVPVILTTAASNSEALAESLAIKDLLKKPFEVDELISRIGRYISDNNPHSRSA